jgi:glycosyltransferase involved in cell wall biosynthesis
VPAYRSEAFLAQTLASLDAQSYPNLRIVVSVDPSDDDTEGVARSFATRQPIEVVVQPRRLGWVGNTNAALDRVQTDLFFICPHDDLVLPDYVSTLQGLLSARPEATGAYCDVQTFGKIEEVRRVTDLDSDLADRLCSLLLQRREGVPWRALTRSMVLRNGIRMRDNHHSGFHSHVAWVLELLAKGPFLHHPEALYRRHERSDQHSVVSGWLSWSADERAAALKISTLECFRILATAELTFQEWGRVSEALIARLRRRWPKARPGSFPSLSQIETELLAAATEMRTAAKFSH